MVFRDKKKYESDNYLLRLGDNYSVEEVDEGVFRLSVECIACREEAFSVVYRDEIKMARRIKEMFDVFGFQFKGVVCSEACKGVWRLVDGKIAPNEKGMKDPFRRVLGTKEPQDKYGCGLRIPGESFRDKGKKERGERGV